MKIFKQYDLLIQVALIIGFAIAALVRLDATFILGYFVVGGWQLISIIIHFIKKWFSKKRNTRNYYLISISFLLLSVVLGLLFPFFLIVFYLLLFAAPFMACYYAWICYDEVYHKMRRPLYQLK